MYMIFDFIYKSNKLVPSLYYFFIFLIFNFYLII
nr:MAG TPA: hypothetical protein [Caudoviricetes sp.]